MALLANKMTEPLPLPEKFKQFGFPTKTSLYSHRSRLEALSFGFKKKRNCTVCVAKTKVQISCAVNAQLICAFVFAYACCGFSYAAAHMIIRMVK